MLKEHQINIRDEQMNDSTIRYWRDKVSSKIKPRKHDVPSSPFHNMLFSNFDMLKIKRASPKKKSDPVEVSTDFNTESEDEFMMYAVVEEPHQDIQPDDVIKADDEIASDHTEEQSDFEEGGSFPQESGCSEQETSLDDLVHDLAADASHNVRTDDDIMEVDKIDDGEKKDFTSEPQPRRSIRTNTSTATAKFNDFVVPPVSKSAQPKWMVCVDYLRTEASSRIFINMADEVSRAMLKLITKTDD
ncbi:unnamed protein product [Mytilus coruscus]|uniref:Uncharacterized protein n=1 Tax=Mytilus coruscus TaxID=42192 RepID=A0A6J8BLA8_MYTCO|nr:unnamed protein product [Mytilus coruscus]